LLLGNFGVHGIHPISLSNVGASGREVSLWEGMRFAEDEDAFFCELSPLDPAAGKLLLSDVTRFATIIHRRFVL